jgi:hypothetical protein
MTSPATGILPSPGGAGTGLDRLWPTASAPLPRASAGLAVLAAVAGAASVAAPVGLGVTLAGLLVLAAAAPTLRGRMAADPAARTGEAACAVLACALLAVPSLRDAGWVVALALTAAVVVAAVGLTGGRTWTGIVAGAAAAPLAPLRGVPWLAKGLTPRRGAAARLLRAARVAALSVLLLAVFGALFASADAVFAGVTTRLLGALLPDVDLGLLPVRVVVGTLIAAAALGAAFLGAAPPRADVLAPGPGRPARWVEWVVPLAVLDALFLTFVGVQVTVLFGGHEHVLGTEGLTYAEYVHQGFAQLLVATVLTLVVVAVAARRAPLATPTGRVAARAVLGTLGVLTLVVVASAVRRLFLYEEAFGFTRARLLATAVELWLGLVVVLVLAAGVRWRGAWLPRAVVLTGAGTLLALAAVNPDASIAERNLDRLAATGQVDLSYLAGLSADAVPVLQRLPEPYRSCLVGPDMPASRSWLGWNLGRDRARPPATHATAPVCQQLDGG